MSSYSFINKTGFDKVLIQSYHDFSIKNDTLKFKLLVLINNETAYEVYYPQYSSQTNNGCFIIDKSTISIDVDQKKLILTSSNLFAGDYSIDTVTIIKAGEKKLLLFESRHYLPLKNKRKMSISYDLLIFKGTEILNKVNSGKCNFACLNTYNNYNSKETILKYTIEKNL